MAAYGENLHALRKAAGLSQEKLAGLTGFSKPTIQNWESGRTTPSIDDAERMADYFDVTLDAIIGRRPPDASRAAEKSVSEAVEQVREGLEDVARAVREESAARKRQRSGRS